MKKIIITFIIIISVLNISNAQQTISGESEVGSLSIRPVPKSPPVLSEINPTFKDANGNNILDANETATISFNLQNKGKGDAYGIKTNISITNDAENIEVTTPPTITILKSNRTETVTIPLKTNFNLSDGQTTLLITVTEANGFDADPIKITIPTAAFKAPQMGIGDYVFSSDAGKEVKKGIPISLTVLVQNKGQGKADAVKIKFINPDPKNLFITSDTEFTLDELEAGEGKVVTLDFFTNKRFEGDTIPISYLISEGYGKYGTKNKIEAKINQKIQPVRENIIEPIRPNVSTERLDIIWLNPNPNKLNDRALVLEKGEINVELTIISTQNIEKRHCSIWINGIKKIGKLGEGRLIKNNDASSYSYTYSNTISVPEGTSSIEIEVDNIAGRKRSVPLKTVYSAGKPNLHILAIGPDYKESNQSSTLQYTKNDAEDFIETYATQKGKNRLFGQIYPTAVLGKDASGVGIKNALTIMSNNYSDGIIAPNDIVILFISSHGYIEPKDGKFRIQGNDFNGAFYPTTAVSFEEIMAQLTMIECKKLVFIDACHSGGARGQADVINKAIIELSQTTEGLTIFTSSKANEISYEHNRVVKL